VALVSNRPLEILSKFLYKWTNKELSRLKPLVEGHLIGGHLALLQLFVEESAVVLVSIVVFQAFVVHFLVLETSIVAGITARLKGRTKAIAGWGWSSSNSSSRFRRRRCTTSTKDCPNSTMGNRRTGPKRHTLSNSATNATQHTTAR
jgi:hypothetical protein